MLKNMYTKTLLTAIWILIGMVAHAQDGTGFGVKIGIGHNRNGNITVVDNTNNQEIAVESANSGIGFHVGLWTKWEFERMYLRPEFILSHTKSYYDNFTYDISRIDVPLLLGITIVEPIHIFVGPVFQYLSYNGLESSAFNDRIEHDEVAFNLHAGLGVDIWEVGFDIRYEHGLSINQATFVSTSGADVSGTIDARPSQIIISASLQL